MKIQRVADRSEGVGPVRKPALHSPAEERNGSAGPYVIQDRVTISSKARELSKKFVSPVLDHSADSIFSYEIRVPLNSRVFKKT